MSRLSSIILVLFMALASVGLASAQMVHLPPGIAQGPTPGTGDTPVTSGDDIQRQQAIAANQERQVEIKRDTEKMSELTQELKNYLETKSPGVMSVDAIKKAEQIEKLARSVKSKMKQSF